MTIPFFPALLHETHDAAARFEQDLLQPRRSRWNMLRREPRTAFAQPEGSRRASGRLAATLDGGGEQVQAALPAAGRIEAGANRVDLFAIALEVAVLELDPRP